MEIGAEKPVFVQFYRDLKASTWYKRLYSLTQKKQNVKNLEAA